MALYKVNFTLNGERHFTTGNSYYPSEEDFNNGNYSKDIALRNALLFIAGYKDVYKIDGDVNPDSVSYTIHFDMSF